jgi:hypothetical protein
MNISERGYIAQDIIRDIRRGTTNIEMELMPEDNNFFDFTPDADKVTSMASAMIANLNTLIDRIQGTT